MPGKNGTPSPLFREEVRTQDFLADFYAPGDGKVIFVKPLPAC
jgi:hypothetical protein